MFKRLHRGLIWLLLLIAATAVLAMFIRFDPSPSGFIHLTDDSSIKFATWNSRHSLHIGIVDNARALFTTRTPWSKEFLDARILFAPIGLTGGGQLLVIIPLWQIAVCATAYPCLFYGLRSILKVRRRRKFPNECLHCSYDLTGNESGACSECGSPVQQPTDAEGTT